MRLGLSVGAMQLLSVAKLELGEDAWFMPNNECIEKICWDVRPTSWLKCCTVESS